MMIRLDNQIGRLKACIEYEHCPSKQRKVQFVNGTNWENIPKEHRIPFIIMGKKRYEYAEWIQILDAWNLNMLKKVTGGTMNCFTNKLSLYNDDHDWYLYHRSTWDHSEELRTSSKVEIFS